MINNTWISDFDSQIKLIMYFYMYVSVCTYTFLSVHVYVGFQLSGIFWALSLGVQMTSCTI